MGPYATFGERLIERGYAAIPILPGSKKPGYQVHGGNTPLTGWSKLFENGPPPEDVLDRWCAGNTGVAVLGGHRGLVAVDIDTDDPAIRAAILAVLPVSPVGKRGAKGDTLFYHAPGIASQSWTIDGRRILDLISTGRQTLIPPTIHPEGEPYRWTTPLTLHDVEPEELPILPWNVAELISDALKPFGWHPEPKPSAVNGDAETPHRALNDAAMANLAAWVPGLNLRKCRPTRGGYEAVADWRPSSTGQPLEKRKRNLKNHPNGIKDFGADRTYTPIDLVMAADGCDLDTAFRYLSERLGWNTGIDVSGLIPAAPAKAPPSEPAPTPPEPPGIEQFTRPPGVLGEIIDWICATARRPNRVMALGAAVTVVGTLIGRRAATPTRSGTHLYIVPIAGTGGGKQHPMDAIRTLMASASAESLVTGPTRFFSLSAVERHMMAKPLSIVMLDEIGAFLKGVTSSKASTHEAGISQILRTAWGTSFKTIETTHRAQERSALIRCPALSIYGASTPDEFLAAMQGDSEGNGFLNRILKLNAGKSGAEVNPELDPDIVPDGLKDALLSLHEWGDPKSLGTISNHNTNYIPDVCPWASDAAEKCYRQLSRTVERFSEDNPESANYIARTAETAVRIATIRAAGRWGYGASVDLSDMEWGAGIAWTSSQSMATDMLEFLPENERSQMTKRIAAYVKRRGPVKVKHIQQFLKGRLKSGDIKDILSQLVESGSADMSTDGWYV